MTPDFFFSMLDPDWLASQLHEPNLVPFIAWTGLIVVGAFMLGRAWNKRANEMKALREVEKRTDEIRDYKEEVYFLSRRLEKTTEAMEKSTSEMLKSVDFGETVREHINSQDAQLEDFFNTILNMSKLIDEMNGVITSLTKDRMAMLSDTEREVLETVYRSDVSCEVLDKDVAEHLVSLGALDKLPSGSYAVSGEWRRSMSKMPKYKN